MIEVANTFNTFFVNIGKELAENVPDPRSNQYGYCSIERNVNSMFLSPVEESEIIQIVSKCKNKTSNDCNNVDMVVVKNVIDAISKPLTYNLSFQSGKFPNQMKIAKVIPLYKSGDKHQFTNYRPVSLLPQFSKTFCYSS